MKEIHVMYLLQDSEETKGDYLTRILRLTYCDVSSVYTLTVRITATVILLRKARDYQLTYY